MSTVIHQTVAVFADTIPDTPAASIRYYLSRDDGPKWVVTLFTGKNSEEQTPHSSDVDAAVAVAVAHADAVDATDSKDTNLDLVFKIKELEAIIAELRGRQGVAAVEAVK